MTGNESLRWINSPCWDILGVIVVTASIDWAVYIQNMQAQKSRSSGYSAKAMTANMIMILRLRA